MSMLCYLLILFLFLFNPKPLNHAGNPTHLLTDELLQTCSSFSHRIIPSRSETELQAPVSAAAFRVNNSSEKHRLSFHWTTRLFNIIITICKKMYIIVFSPFILNCPNWPKKKNALIWYKMFCKVSTTVQSGIIRSQPKRDQLCLPPCQRK